MAAPPSKTVKNLNGKWSMNKTLSDSVEPGLALQGIGWLVRKGVGMASVTQAVSQYDGPPNPPSDSTEPVTHIVVVQTATGGIKGTTEHRCVDLVGREHSDWLFGRVIARSSWTTPDEIEDAYLKRDWLWGEGEADVLLWNQAESADGGGWVATQIWGFQTINGQRMHARNVTIEKGSQKVEFRIVYDWLGEE